MAGSKAQAGRGTVLDIMTGVGQSTPTPVAEINSISLSGRQMGTEETTHLQSTAREFCTTVLAPGTWDIQGNRISSDAGQIAVETAFAAGTMQNWKIILPVNAAAGQTTTGDTYAFSALIEEWVYGPFAVDKKIQVSGKLKTSGSITFTAGT